MKGSRPLTDKEVERCLACFSGRFRARNRALFLIGINTGFRVSELLSLRLGDVIEKDGKITSEITVWKWNTKGKIESRSMFLNELSKKALAPWLQELEQRDIVHKDDFIFKSMRGARAITKERAWVILHEVFEGGELKGKLGTHCMRKTFAIKIYLYNLSRVAAGEPVDAFRLTSKALGHQDIKSTDQYLPFSKEDIEKAVMAICNLRLTNDDFRFKI